MYRGHASLRQGCREERYPGIKGISVKAFAEQFSYLQHHYGIISLEQYLGFLRGEEDVPRNAAILSFDGGLKDHYSHVFPILRERGLPACFYPLTSPLTEGWVQPVQKVHFLLAKMATEHLSLWRLRRDQYRDLEGTGL